MKKLLFFVIFISAMFYSGAAQTRKKAVKTVPKKVLPAKTETKPETKVTPTTEIPELEWNEIIKSLEAENWNKSSNLSLLAMKKFKTDNEKKQLARLCYFYLYSLAGKVAENTMSSLEFERISKDFIGQDFLMPSREILSDCKEKVNYLCPVKADENSLRITVTNKTATNIYSFEYVRMPEKIDFLANNGKEAFLGGKLKKAEINTFKNDIKIVKLSFEEGYADIVKPDLTPVRP